MFDRTQKSSVSLDQLRHDYSKLCKDWAADDAGDKLRGSCVSTGGTAGDHDQRY